MRRFACVPTFIFLFSTLAGLHHRATAQISIEIRPVIKKAIGVLNESVNVIGDNSKELEEKKKALHDLGELITEQGSKGGEYEKYPQVTEALKVVYRRWESKIRKDTVLLMAETEKTGRLVDRLDQIDGLNTAELRLVRSKENELKRLLINRLGIMEKISEGIKDAKFGNPKKINAKITGLELLTSSSFLPEGTVADKTVTAIGVIFNHDGNKSHTGDWHIKIVSGPAKIKAGKNTKLFNDGKYAIIRVEDVPPFVFRIVSFTIEVGTETSKYQPRFYPFKLPLKPIKPRD